MDKKWFVFYTHSRAEKKTKENLERFGFEVFLPLMKTVRQWSDRKKKVEVPLFNSYLFVHEEPHRIQEILKIPGIAWSIRHNGEPAFLRQEEKEAIDRILISGYSVEAEQFEELQEFDRVKITEGSLKGMEGNVLKNSPNKVVILLDSIGQSIKVEITSPIIQKIS